MRSKPHIMPALLFAMLMAMVSGAQAATFDAFTDFSTASNPNGAWTYGFETTLGGALTLYDQPSGTTVWRHSVVQSLGAPADFITSTTAGFHPGQADQFSVFRFTAPSAGAYSLSSSFSPLDSTTTDVHVLLNGVGIFSGIVDASHSPTFTTLLTLGAGSTIDFAVGFGENNNFFSDSTALTATLRTVEAVAEPGTLMLLGTGLAALSRAAWKRTRQSVVARRP
jgi:hypothetical protein